MGSNKKIIYNKIPTDEEIKRAIELDNKRNYGLSDTSLILEKKYKNKGVHRIYFFYEDVKHFSAIIFYRWHSQIEEAKKSGLSDEVIDSIYECLEKFGRGKRNEIKLDVEYDSHENVTKKFHGNYDKRLR